MHNKEKIQLVIVGVLFIVFIGAFLNTMKKSKPKEDSALNQPIGLNNPLPQNEGQPQVTFLKLQEESRKLKLKRDPFTLSPIEVDQGPHLQGIVWDAKHPTAVINGQILGVGSQFDGSKIVEIRKDRIIFNDGTKNFELILGQ